MEDDRDLDMSTMWGETAAQTSAPGSSRGDWFRDSRFAMFIHCPGDRMEATLEGNGTLASPVM